jgi:hypothetical protein
MKYLLFVNFENNLKHNAIYETIQEVIASARNSLSSLFSPKT